MTSFFYDPVFKEENMEFVVFLVIGVIAGWIASVLVAGEGSGMFSDVIIGAVGALVGGALYRFFDITLYGFWGSLGMATIGAVTFLLTIGVFYKNRSHPNTKL